jgi:hypothetical protein
LFRSKLLYEKGGWWADLDIVLLNKLPKLKRFFGGQKGHKYGRYKTKDTYVFWSGLMKHPPGTESLLTAHEKIKVLIAKNNPKTPFYQGQTIIGEELRKEFGYLETANKKANGRDVNLLKFNPFAPNDMKDFQNEDLTECCKRWGWAGLKIPELFDTNYTVHLYNTMILRSKKRNYIIDMLEDKISK